MFLCSDCGFESKKWLGKCTSCGSFNTMKEFKESKITKISKVFSKDANNKEVKKLSNFENFIEEKIITEVQEFDRVLSGGIQNSSVILVSGPPGIGKSTLLLQIANNLSKRQKVLYVSGEESGNQVLDRAKRLTLTLEDVDFLNNTCVEAIIEVAKDIDAKLLIVDSIQTIYSSEVEGNIGSVSQVRTATAILTNYAKENNVAIVIVGHVNKDGQVAGPKVLEHIVDTIINFEESHEYGTRILKCVKNRFGSVNEIGIFQMTETGLVCVTNPSEFFLSSGTNSRVFFATSESKRSFLLEVEALVTKSYIPVPRRVVIGWDNDRLSVVLALFSKNGLKFYENDVYVTIASGFSTQESTADLSFAIAILKNYFNLNLSDICAIGEIGLSGVIKGKYKIKERVLEAKKFGVKTFIIPDVDLKIDGVLLIKVTNIKQLIHEVQKLAQAL